MIDLTLSFPIRVLMQISLVVLMHMLLVSHPDDVIVGWWRSRRHLADRNGPIDVNFGSTGSVDAHRGGGRGFVFGQRHENAFRRERDAQLNPGGVHLQELVGGGGGEVVLVTGRTDPEDVFVSVHVRRVKLLTHRVRLGPVLFERQHMRLVVNLRIVVVMVIVVSFLGGGVVVAVVVMFSFKLVLRRGHVFSFPFSKFGWGWVMRRCYCRAGRFVVMTVLSMVVVMVSIVMMI